ncbi:MAG: trifunctional transcriptional activator/DNA repair protein Ada/methylated-DNA--[protein]-cysteine S-methyltransferase [Planctomycetota bacterium]|nr:trifunctional transcriptional activator/DNA repair protein Ada/methylated-DNA--[protein]-cysteine S-methyltransferase [Planctomycetota bacterium]
MITTLPTKREMYRASLERDASFEGVFVLAVKTTGIFCRPTCPARKPKEVNVEYFANTREAIKAGYRACKRCKPLEPEGETPGWLRPLMESIERDPSRRWRDKDLRGLDLEPTRVRRWFKEHHGLTFQAYHRARRLGLALGRLRHGEDLLRSGLDTGFDSASGFRDAFAKCFGSPPGRSRRTPSVVVSRVLTPLGPMVAGASEAGLCLLEYPDQDRLQRQLNQLRRLYGDAIVPGRHELFAQLDEELTSYFEGSRTLFEIPLDLRGTEFQLETWNQLLTIEYGTTCSYHELAENIGRAGAQRAVGRANGDNRMSILIPCHRVVRSDGSLSGYGGGLWRKQWLLNHEFNSHSID